MKKEFLQTTIVKTLLVILSFTGMGIIIIGGGYIISEHYKNTTNNQSILLSENISLTTDKTEYQAGDEVKLTIENNLDEEIEFYVVVAEKFNNNKWKEIRFDIECLGLCMKIQTVINSKNNKSFSWDQKDNIGLQIMGGKFRFRVGVWDNDWNGSGLPLMFNYYSNEFTIKDSVISPLPGNMVCDQDSDCEINYADYCCGKWEGCFNKYDNPGNIGDLNDPNCKCVKREPIKECRCVNNVCQRLEEQPDTSSWQTYQNEEFGFEFTLSELWKGYKVFKESWKGTTLDGNAVEYNGPKIIIRNPKWSKDEIWQDIPVLVFTKNEWQLVEANNLNIFVAPIAPEKLGENNKYVFALPPRWIGFTDALGQDEAQEIIKTFKAFDLDGTSDWKTYRNEKYGFEVKYPKDWEVKDKFSKGIGVIFLSEIFNNKQEKVMNIIVSEKSEGQKITEAGGHGTNKELFKISGLNVMKEYYDNRFLRTSIELEDNYILFEIYSETSIKESELEIINQIISSFKFIEN